MGIGKTTITIKSGLCKTHGIAMHKSGKTVRWAPARPDPWLYPLMLLALACGLALCWAVRDGRLPVSTLLLWPLLNVLTFAVYWQDKHAARKQAWRTSERTLHMLSLLGGWPAARLAQQVLRHKSAKASFQLGYGATVLLNVAALVGWFYLRAPLAYLG
jgi:uncharacterized membrane protein YsdA (DUF1294 family)